MDKDLQNMQTQVLRVKKLHCSCPQTHDQKKP